MKVEEFDYDLPKELIAQTPLEKRDESRLLVLHKKSKKIEDKKFSDIIDYLNKGDTLVLNDTKVIPARLIGKKEETGAIIEVLLLKELENNKWEALSKPARRVKVGTIIDFNDILKLKCVEVKEEGIRVYELIYEGILMEVLDKLGTMPLPPYIHEKLKEQNRYQTVYAKHLGSSAAPTAGLHFTKDLLKRIKDKGINIVYLTLHVGLGTFRPVEVENIENHHMHSEYYSISKETADIINKTINENKKVVAVGTTSVRTLESVMKKYNKLKADSDTTDIFIYPGYEFRIVDNLITNFHLPKSTLIMLVSTLAGKDLIMKAYKHAVDNKYRFFSFGDSMFIIDD